VPCQSHQVGVVKSVADLGGLVERGVCSRDVAFAKALQCDRQEQITLLDGIVLVVVKQPVGTCEPTSRCGRLAPAE
jgi:hypothetical protein